MDLSSQVGLRLQAVEESRRLVLGRRRNGPEQSGGIATRVKRTAARGPARSGEEWT